MSGVRLPFESLTERVVRGYRALQRKVTNLYNIAYINEDGEPQGLVGTSGGPYINVLGRASTDPTAVTPPGSVAVADGEDQRLLVDQYGRLVTSGGGGTGGEVVADRYVGTTAQTPGDDAVAAYDTRGRLLTFDHAPIALASLLPSGGAAVPALVAKASAGVLWEASGYNETGATVYAQIHNTAAAPGAGAVPIASIGVPTGNVFSFSWDDGPVNMTTGISLVLSSTLLTYTALAASQLYTLNVRYE